VPTAPAAAVAAHTSTSTAVPAYVHMTDVGRARWESFHAQLYAPPAGTCFSKKTANLTRLHAETSRAYRAAVLPLLGCPAGTRIEQFESEKPGVRSELLLALVSWLQDEALQLIETAGAATPPRTDWAAFAHVLQLSAADRAEQPAAPAQRTGGARCVAERHAVADAALARLPLLFCAPLLAVPALAAAVCDVERRVSALRWWVQGELVRALHCFLPSLLLSFALNASQCCLLRISFFLSSSYSAQ
jgi:hypothetical protein